MKGLKRRCGHVGVGSGQFLDGSQRLSQVRAHGGRGGGYSGQYASLIGCRYLLATENLAGGAVHRIDRNHVGTTQRSDGSRQIGFHAKPLPYLLREFRRDSLILRLSEVLQIVVQLHIADQLDHGRLLELNGQRLFQGGIENGIAGLIRKIRQDKLVLIGQLWSSWMAEVEDRRNRSGDNNEGSENEVPPFPGSDGSTGSGRNSCGC